MGDLTTSPLRLRARVVTINGVQVVTTNDLNQNVEIVEKPVTL